MGSSIPDTVLFNREDIFVFPKDFCNLFGVKKLCNKPAITKLMTNHPDAPFNILMDAIIISFIKSNKNI